MKHLSFIISLLLLILAISCGSKYRQTAFQEMKKLELARKIDSKKFIAWLNHRDSDIRLRAVETLGRIQDTSTAILIANRLNDESVSVRAAAAFSLGQMYWPLAEKPLLDALGKERDLKVKIKISEALGKCGTEQSFSSLKTLLVSQQPVLVQNAAIAHGILAYRDRQAFGNAKALEALLGKSPDPDIRWRAAYALYRIQNPVSFKAIFQNLDDPEAKVRFFLLKAIYGLITTYKSPEFQEFRSHKSIRENLEVYQSIQFQQKLNALAQDSVWYVRISALQVLGLDRKPAQQKVLIKALRDSHPYVRMEAIRALKNFQNGRTQRELMEVYGEDPDWRIRGEALSALAEMNPRKAFRIVERDMLRENWPKNVYAIKALQEISSAEATHLLQQLADSDNPAQTSLALEALVNRPDAPQDFLLQTLKKGDPAHVTIISLYLGYQKNPEAVEPLLAAYQKFSAPRDMETMQAILVALDSIGSSRALAFLEKELRNPYPLIRRLAYRALVRIKRNSNIAIPEVEDSYLTRWDFPVIDVNSRPKAKVFTTAGEFTIELYPDKAPITVANFIDLVRQGFYDNLFFHRVIPGFVVQGGDPRGDGWGGPGYAIPCEYNDLFYDRGVVGMAHAGKDTGGSQIFITHLPQPHLNGKHTAFGKVISGMEVVDRIMNYDKIQKIEIIE